VSEATPDRVVAAIYDNARGIGAGPVVSLNDWRRYYRDLDGWFMYWGRQVDMSLKKVGGGLYRIEGTFR
jgi:hypothetical protein